MQGTHITYIHTFEHSHTYIGYQVKSLTFFVVRSTAFEKSMCNETDVAVRLPLLPPYESLLQKQIYTY